MRPPCAICAVASGFLLLLFLYRGWRPVAGGDLIWLALMGITGVVSFNLFFFAALQHITASRAALIVSTNWRDGSHCRPDYYSDARF